MTNIRSLGTRWLAFCLATLVSTPLWAADEGDASSINPLTVDPDLAIFTLIVFVVLLAFLTKFAWRPLMDALDEREKSIADTIDEAKRSADEAQLKLQQYEARLAAAAEEARQIVARARTDAEVAAERIRTEAEETANRERQRAIADIRTAKEMAIQEVANKGADLAFQLAGQILRRELKRDDHSQLVREALEQMPSSN